MSLRIAPEYFINYVSLQETVRVFDYDQDSMLWKSTKWTGDRVWFDFDLDATPGFSYEDSADVEIAPPLLLDITTTEGAIVIDGDYALFVKEDGAVECGWVTTNLYPDLRVPRLDFYRQIDSVPTRFASLTKTGILSVTNILEDTIPDGQDRLFLFQNLNCSIGLDGLICKSVKEISLIVTPNGDYLATPSGQILEAI